MKIDLSGKTALVTGSTADIGYAVAKGLAATGANVVVNGRTRSKIDAAVGSLTKAPALGPHHFHLLGVGTPYSERDDPLRHDQDGATCDFARSCENDQRDRRHGQFSAARADHVRGLAKQNGQSVEEAASLFVKQHRPTSLLQRFASVEEIANMVVYVSSKEAPATNDAALRAEGGIVQTIA